jgi:GTP diphosphokinase / guanosine-3',5'-bis(diphosphate) 3'-diphosphatase
MPRTLTVVNDEEKKLIRRAYRRLMRSIKSPLNDEDRKNIRKAYEIGVDAHSKQRRRSGEPYILHPLEVAKICVTELGLGPTAIVSAILHDVVEDTDITHDEIKAEFGPKISRIVDGLTKLDGLYNVESPQAENFKKVISTLVEDVRVVLIKMADRLHNLRTIGPMPRHKQLKIAAETDYIYAPLAHRLGLYNIKTEFQDHILKINEPEIYAEIEKKLQETRRDRTKYISEFLKPVKSELDGLKARYRTAGRSKAISSIYNKIKQKQVPFEEIYDLFAVRIIIDVALAKEKQYCWQFYSIITEIYKPIPERLKDWVSTPKANGYESLHTTVVGPKGRFVEVQIRTERMDEIAERGFAAHWKYKKIKTNDHVFDAWLDNVRDMLDHNHNDAVEFLSDFKTNLFKEEIYVYTPAGDMKILPKGGTALDFAFSVHSDVGYHSTAIKVNNKLVPMGYKLNNGDQVTVTTSKNQKPTEDWLKMVVTGKARAKIRSAMKEEKRKHGEIGQETLQRKLKHIKAGFEENIDFLVKYFDFNSRPDLYYAIAVEELDLAVLKTFKVAGHIIVPPEKEVQGEGRTDDKPKSKRAMKRMERARAKIMVNGESAEQYQYHLAGCCNPVQGDDIFAYLTVNTGLKIHRTSCPNATHLMANYGYRIMKAEWAEGESASFVADLWLTGVDDGPGVIERVTSQISSTLGINIRSFSIAGDEGYFEGRISLIVSNIIQLNQVIKSLESLEGISRVTRVD